MQGRQREAEHIADELDGRDAPAIVVIGPPGIGKTTLVRSVLDDRPHAEATALVGLQWKPYLPLSSALGTELRGDPETVAAEAQRLLDGRILFLDDLQWADPGTATVVGVLAGRIPIVVTVRAGAELPRWACSATSVAVRPLTEAASRSLGRRLHPTATSEQIDHLVALSGGSPLLLQHLARDGRATPTLRAAVTARLTDLPAVQRTVVTDLAVLGRPLLVDKLEIAVDALPTGLIVVDGGLASIGHALLAEATIASLDAAALAGTHRRLAGFLPDAEAAEHLLAAGDPDAASTAALRALGSSCDPAARAHLLSIVALAGDDPRRHVEAAGALVCVGRWEDAARHAAAVRTDDPVLLAEAAYHRSRARWFAGDPVGARSAAEAGLRAVDGSGCATEARLLVELAHQRVRVDEQTCATTPIATRALEAAERAGVDVLRARMVHATALAHDASPGWEDPYRQVIRDAAAAGDGEIECAAAFFLASHLGFGGRIREAIAVLEPMIVRADEIGQLTWRTHLKCALLTDRFLGGADPVALSDDCRAFIDDHPLFRNVGQIVLIAALTLADQERFTEAHAILERVTRSLTSTEDRSILLAAATELEWAAGDFDAVRRVSADAIALAPGWFGITAGASAAAALADLELDESVVVAVPSAKVPIFAPFTPEVEALRAVGRGDTATALDLLDHAADAWDRIGTIRYASRARWAAGVVARRAGHHSARRRLEYARDQAAQGGVRTIARRAADELAALDGHPSLTSRERRILELVGDGCTSQAIAERLGISRFTVESHVRSAMRKLGARTRRQAVASLRSAAAS